MSLEQLRDDDTEELSPILRVAAQAAILMVDKYTILTEESEIYYITIGMSVFLWKRSSDNIDNTSSHVPWSEARVVQKVPILQ